MRDVSCAIPPLAFVFCFKKWEEVLLGCFGTFRLCKEELGRTGSVSVFYLCALGTWGRRLEQGEGKCSEID